MKVYTVVAGQPAGLVDATRGDLEYVRGLGLVRVERPEDQASRLQREIEQDERDRKRRAYNIRNITRGGRRR